MVRKTGRDLSATPVCLTDEAVILWLSRANRSQEECHMTDAIKPLYTAHGTATGRS